MTAMLTLTITLSDPPVLALTVDDGPPDPEYVLPGEVAGEVLDVVETVTGRDLQPDSPTLPDDLIDAVDPEIVPVERASVDEAAGQTAQFPADDG